jgi:hypothetical protein
VPLEAIMVLFSAWRAANFDAKTAFAAIFLRIAALACAFVTSVLAVIVLSWQAGTWILTGKWSSFPISRVLALAGFDEPPAIHAAADIQRIFDWGVDLPASGFLLAIAAMLIGFSVFAATVEEQFGKG